MNREEQFLTSDEERLIDRLVDGELSDQERRELLLKFENQSDGWRRCALAFLEAQTWGKEFRSLTAAPAAETVVRPAGRQSSWLNGPWGSALAVAASFLIAFTLGTAWRGLPGPANRNEDHFAQRPTTRPNVDTTSRPSPLAQPDVSDTQWGTVMVSLDGDRDGVAESLELPVAAGREIDEEWLRNQPSALPPHVRKALERLGHEVRQQRQLFPIDLDDGRRVVVPVDQVDVHYVGNRRYQ
jgi:hypothetical protein